MDLALILVVILLFPRNRQVGLSSCSGAYWPESLVTRASGSNLFDECWAGVVGFIIIIIITESIANCCCVLNLTTISNFDWIGVVHTSLVHGYYHVILPRLSIVCITIQLLAILSSSDLWLISIVVVANNKFF